MTRNEIFHLYRASALAGMLGTIGAGKEPHKGVINLSNAYAMEALATIPEGYEPDTVNKESEEENVPEITITKCDRGVGRQGDSPDDVVVDPADKPARTGSRPARGRKSKK